jgi:hypothetical protein
MKCSTNMIRSLIPIKDLLLIFLKGILNRIRYSKIKTKKSIKELTKSSKFSRKDISSFSIKFSSLEFNWF